MVSQRSPRAHSPGAMAATTSLAPWGRALVGFIVVAWAAALGLGFTTGLALITLAGYAAALIGLTRPAVGFIGIGILCTLDAASRIFLLTGGLFRYNTLNYILLFVSLLAFPVVLRFRDVHTRLLQILIALLAAEILLSPDLTFGVQHVLNAVSIIGLLVYIELGGKRPEAWIWFGIASGTMAALGGLVYYLQKATLPYANANAMAYLPLGGMFTVCLAFRFADSQRYRQLLLAFLAGCNLIWVFLSGSRGGLLVGGLCVLFLVHSTPGFGRRVLVLATLAILALGISAQFTSMQEYAVHRWEALLDPARSLSSRTSGRSDLMLGGWYMFQEHPFGVGTGGFASAWANLGRREGLSGFQQGHEFQAHAGWIKILAENGLPGILLLAAFASSFAVVGLRHRDRRLRLLGCFTTLVLTAAWTSTEFQLKPLWLLAGSTATLLRPVRMRVEDSIRLEAAVPRPPLGAGP